jgi:hypothetical protein
VDKSHDRVGLEATVTIGDLQGRLGRGNRAELGAIEVEPEARLGPPLSGEELANGLVEDAVVEAEAKADAGPD